MKLSVKGLETIKAQLAELDAELQPKVMRAATRAAFKRVLDAAKGKVPVDSGELREALALGTAKTKGGGLAVGIVVLATSTRAKQARLAAAAFGEAQSAALPPARRWHFVELGTARQPPKPFLRPAADEEAQGVVQALSEEVAKKVKRALKKKGGGK